MAKRRNKSLSSLLAASRGGRSKRNFNKPRGGASASNVNLTAGRFRRKVGISTGGRS